MDWISRIKLEDQERNEAARLIQLVWKHYLRRMEKREEASSGDEDYSGQAYHLITVPCEKEFQVRFQQQCRNMRRVRRRLVELEARTGDRLDGHHRHHHPTRYAPRGRALKRMVKDKKGRFSSTVKNSGKEASGNVGDDPRLIPAAETYSACGAAEIDEQWEAKRRRMRTYYEKAAKHLQKLMAELERDI